MILDYIDALNPGPKLLTRDGSDSWRTLAKMGQALGLLEGIVTWIPALPPPSRPVYREGQPVESREAVVRRDRLIQKLASLPPVPGALDQIVQQFGTDLVAMRSMVSAISARGTVITASWMSCLSLDAIAALFAEDGQFVNARGASAFGDRYSGRREVRDYCAELFASPNLAYRPLQPN